MASAAPRQYGFPGHSVAASPLMSLWHQMQAQRAVRAAPPGGGASAAAPAGAALRPLDAMSRQARALRQQ